ncbi:Cysteine-rich receptor-like protein kinase [Actinidia chinensis var. chinensis]|uniref:Cysteine-rich receptor-like protein kinase n=1 Tax=Actinidia chinensis var. chinensis TaxID=1590841 RepID=A0A2R6PAV5_ACTCC|nr:Cysteine-rich receptor-like protein kinase [Actinidia chinensis var. chinensis]
MENLLRFFRPTREGNNEEELGRIAAQGQKRFSLETLVSATQNFHPSHKLGEGGFGPVYKGKLDDGREIAVKKLSKSSGQGKKEFMNEAKVLARMQHRNVVNLFGYCAHGEEKLLVYEYVANESLDKHLFKSGRRDALDWKQRYDIITGIARGLLYLHRGSHEVITHRDIKASNILLDDKWIPKIADFGMARLFPEDQTHVNTRVAGTNGYMAPEYVMHGRLSPKADVYSFGVLVLELISGQKNSSFIPSFDDQNLLEWAYRLYKNGKSLDVMDPILASSAVPNQVAMCVQIGLLCTQADPQYRPDMDRVVVMLSKKPGTLEDPRRPGYPGSRYRRSRHPTESLFSAGTNSGQSDSHSYGSTSNTNSHNASATATTSTLEEPRRPGYPSSRYRRSRDPTESSFGAGTNSGQSDSHTYGSTSNTNSSNASATATATATRSTLEEPRQPGYPGSSYRRSRNPTESSFSTGTNSGQSDSHTHVSAINTNSRNAYTTATATATANRTKPRADPRGKRPMKG